MKTPAIRNPVKAVLLASAVVLSLSAGVAVTVSASNEHAHSHAMSGANRPVPVAAASSSDINAARQATAQFHDIEVAKASGYPEDLTGCVESPDGGMGHHFVNPTLENDGGQVDVTKPEALVYEPQEDGSLSLVALEYIVRADDVPSTGPAPVLFGQQFTFSAAANAWTHHAWVWRNNPSGMFAPFNPQVSCQFAS